jgi:hypothetical protein
MATRQCALLTYFLAAHGTSLSIFFLYRSLFYIRTLSAFLSCSFLCICNWINWSKRCVETNCNLFDATHGLLIEDLVNKNVQIWTFYKQSLSIVEIYDLYT